MADFITKVVCPHSVARMFQLYFALKAEEVYM